jgi:hypothetical protein
MKWTQMEIREAANDTLKKKLLQIQIQLELDLE